MAEMAAEKDGKRSGEPGCMSDQDDYAVHGRSREWKRPKLDEFSEDSDSLAVPVIEPNTSLQPVAPDAHLCFKPSNKVDLSGTGSQSVPVTSHKRQRVAQKKLWCSKSSEKENLVSKHSPLSSSVVPEISGSTSSFMPLTNKRSEALVCASLPSTPEMNEPRERMTLSVNISGSTPNKSAYGCGIEMAQKERNECSIVVKDLPLRITKAEIRSYFGSAGVIKDISYVSEKRLAFIIYSTANEAKDAVKRFHHSRILQASTLRVENYRAGFKCFETPPRKTSNQLTGVNDLTLATGSMDSQSSAASMQLREVTEEEECPHNVFSSLCNQLSLRDEQRGHKETVLSIWHCYRHKYA